MFEKCRGRGFVCFCFGLCVRLFVGVGFIGVGIFFIV